MMPIIIEFIANTNSKIKMWIISFCDRPVREIFGQDMHQKKIEEKTSVVLYGVFTASRLDVDVRRPRVRIVEDTVLSIACSWSSTCSWSSSTSLTTFSCSSVICWKLVDRVFWFFFSPSTLTSCFSFLGFRFHCLLQLGLYGSVFGMPRSGQDSKFEMRTG
jgi:hypothetical protein